MAFLLLFVFGLNWTLVKDLELILDFSRFRREGSRGGHLVNRQVEWSFWQEGTGRGWPGRAMCGDTGISHSRGALSSKCGCFTLPNLIQKTPLWPPYAPSTTRIPNPAALGTGVPRHGPWDSGCQDGLCHYKPASRQVISEINIHLQEVFYWKVLEKGRVWQTL